MEKPEDHVTSADDAVAEEPQVELETPEQASATEPEAEQTEQDLAKLLEEARAKADDNYDQLVRARAELDNLRRRQERDLENAHRYAIEKFVAELVGVWDSLDLGHAAAQDEAADVAKLREGTELTLKQLETVMSKFGVEQLDPQGQAFNPDLHQAIGMQPGGEGVAPNTVIAVVQKGYTLNGRIVRPAMVMVAQ